jgi:hypothetical protein
MFGEKENWTYYSLLMIVLCELGSKNSLGEFSISVSLFV